MRAIAAVLVLAAAFYAGIKFDALSDAFARQKRAAALDEAARKFPAASPEELIETGLAAFKKGDWNDASARLLAAKRKNLALPGILFFVGQGWLERGDLDQADAAFAHALAFEEDVADANYQRGVIAMRRHDAPAAAHFFEAAANAAPFTSQMYSGWAEALRLDQHPREAIRRYQQSIERTVDAKMVALGEFKIRLARIEAADAEQIRQEIANHRAAGPLTTDWLMTEAALRLHDGRIPDAVQLIDEARAQDQNGLFRDCADDPVFRRAADAHPDVAAALRSTAG